MEIDMSRRCYSREEAELIAAEFRDLHIGTDWVVTIHRPLFEGDFWLVVIN
jgi:hypothetical protein